LVGEFRWVDQELPGLLMPRGQLTHKFSAFGVGPELGRDVDPYSGFTWKVKRCLNLSTSEQPEQISFTV
jgi:hypothetical protein